MGYCVDKTGNQYNMSFEIRRDSVILDGDFYTLYGNVDFIECDKSYLTQLKAFLNDPYWSCRLGLEEENDEGKSDLSVPVQNPQHLTEGYDLSKN